MNPLLSLQPYCLTLCPSHVQNLEQWLIHQEMFKCVVKYGFHQAKLNCIVRSAGK